MTKTTLNARALAEEFGVSDEVMTEFIERFAPAKVAPRHFAANSDIMLFIHIPKTAGVSVGGSLQEAFDSFHGVEWSEIAKSFRQATRQAVYRQTQKTSRQVIMGHFGWSELQLWRNHEMNMKCGTIFREPVARTVSNYFYNLSDAHPGHENFRARFPTLESYVAQLPYDVQMTQAIGFVDSFENALRKFIRYYTFLGITEQLSASLTHLSRSHGLKELREYRKNVGKAGGKDDIDPNIKRRIEAVSHNDNKFHRLLSLLYQA